jgi:hypothetical protein
MTEFQNNEIYIYNIIDKIVCLYNVGVIEIDKIL